MSSFDKVVKLACKPKAAPPKAKYLDPILAATWSEDGAVHDVCKALSPRFREPNAIVVFKALIVLHTMIRNGATDNVLSYLSSSEVLRLKNVSAGNWEGYNAPQNLQHYASYLDARIRAYRDLKHDVVRVQAESNRDMRNSVAIEEDSNRIQGESSGGHQRSKTISGRKLRVMTVEKGLLRETRAVQKTIDTLVECRFYLDDLEDDLTITALRMLVKDLLILFQAGNEGVINVLEHYFEMSHVDAEQALSIYRNFCKQTEKVVEYLGVAKKLQNLLNVPIPNLKHAPVSLAGALQEYLNDPNFEQNRIEYRTNKEAAEKNQKVGSTGASSSSNVKKPDTSAASSSNPAVPPLPAAAPPAKAPSAVTPAKPDASQNMLDFFSGIEEEQPTMFNPQTGSPTANYFQQQAAFNPFVQRQMTGAFGPQPFGAPPQMQPQQTGFLMPQQTAFQVPQQQQQPPPNPFGLQAPQQQQHRPFSSFLQPQSTGFMQPQPTGFLQPQATGSNPFRQSMMFPQTTGFPGPGTNAGSGPSPFQSQNPQGQGVGQAPSSPPSAFSAAPPFASPFGQFSSSRAVDMPARPASTPLRSSSSPPPIQPVKSHQTGSRNPFGVPVAPVPPVPKPPTLLELATGAHLPNSSSSVNGTQNGNHTQQEPQQTGSFSSFNAFRNSPASGQGGSNMASVASSFLGGGKQDDNKNGSAPSFLNSQNTASTAAGSAFSDSIFSSLTTQPTGATTTSGASSAAPAISVSPPLKPQTTGFAGIKAFKPSSSFGASLLESLPPIPQSSPNTPAATGNGTASPNGLPSQQTGFGAFNAQPTGMSGGGSSLGVGLRPQMTGGAANPFRASMLANPTGGAFGGTGSQFSNSSSFGGSQFTPNSSSTSSSAFGSSAPSSNGASSLGSNLFGGGGAFGSTFNPGGANPQQQQQQNGSLI